MRRLLLVLTVALIIMSLGVAGLAWADPKPNPKNNNNNCAGVGASTANPQTTNKGQWAATVKATGTQQRDELAHRIARDGGNCD
jgi:hypothetical protein